MTSRWSIVPLTILAAFLALGVLFGLLATPTARAVNSATAIYCRVVALPIPDDDAAGIEDTIHIDDDVGIERLAVIVTASHRWVGDLEITLASGGERGADEIAVPLLSRAGLDGLQPYGCGSRALAARFDDAAEVTAAEQCGQTLSGTVRSLLPLAIFSGRPLSGAWRLHVADRAPGASGELQGWCLQVTGQPVARAALSPATATLWTTPGMTATTVVTLANRGAGLLTWGSAPLTAAMRHLVAEGFEAGPLPPDGWRQRVDVITATWVNSTEAHHDGLRAAVIPASTAMRDEWLISPAFWLRDGWVTLWTRGSPAQCAQEDSCDLQLRLLVGSNGDRLLGRAERDWTAEQQWTAHGWSLAPDLPAEGERARVAIRYTGQGNAAVDDVQIVGQVVPLPCREPAPSWLAVEPISGIVAPGAQVPLTLRAGDPTLAEGTHEAIYCLPTNDPVTPYSLLTVTLHVEHCIQAAPPAPVLSASRPGTGGEDGLILSWETIPDIETYVLHRGTSPATLVAWQTVTDGTTMDVDPGARRFYRLRAYHCSEQYVASQTVGWLAFTLVAPE